MKVFYQLERVNTQRRLADKEWERRKVALSTQKISKSSLNGKKKSVADF